jgi:hypothetical protein
MNPLNSVIDYLVSVEHTLGTTGIRLQLCFIFLVPCFLWGSKRNNNKEVI